MSKQAAVNSILEDRRDALVDYYIAKALPNQTIDGGARLSDRIKTADDLFEYLLIDTKISALVNTSWVAENIASVQFYINRCLNGYDPDVNNNIGSTMALESKSGGFLHDWDDYNQVFSTWAGKERLQYYPATYLDPTLRYQKTELFKALEETINQGRISDSRVQAAFQDYLLGFETIATLETISGYQAGTDIGEYSADTLYFIGRTQDSPHSYYWRSCNMAVRNDLSYLTGGAWSQWLKITAPVGDAVGNMVKPCWFRDRLYITWISRKEMGAVGSGNNLQPEYRYSANVWYLKEDGNWVSYREETLSDKPYNFALIADAAQSVISSYFDYLGMWEWGGKSVVCYDSMPLNTTNYPSDKAASGSVYYARDLKITVISVSNEELELELECDSNYSVGFRLYDYTYLPYTDEGISRPSGVSRFSLSISNAWRVSASRGLLEDTCFIYVYSNYEAHSSGYPLPNPVFYIEDKSLKLTSSSRTVVLQTDSAHPFLNSFHQGGVSGLLSYNTQISNIELNNSAPINFNGAYGLYFWEVFFHISFMIANRFLNEQNYAESARWYQYLFAPTGYRMADGTLEMIDGDVRYWNVVPLQTDPTWNASVPPTVDPDMIALNDPMHYKLAIFLNSVNRLIEQGDTAYRQLQRDYLAQAKMLYLQASQMLGPRPVIHVKNNWPELTLGEEALAIDASRLVVESGDGDATASASTQLTRLLRAYLAEDNGNFLPPYNDELLMYWDKLEVRLYNLRHNLSLDGQPLSLPLYAEPVSPKDLQRQHGAGNGAGGSSMPLRPLASQFRFVVLLDKARTAVNSVIQFGASLQNALERRDNENLTLLQQTQQQQILGLTQDIQASNITSLQEGLVALQQGLSGAKTRLSHYSNLYNNWISGSEQSAMDLRVAAGALNAAAMIPMAVGAGVEMAPNTFGLAVGGSEWGGVARAVAFGLQGGAMVLETSAQRLDISEQYRRRREDWQVQRDNASSEVAQLEAQIRSQAQQISMAQKQLHLSQQELANQQAVYNLQTTRFTGLELYNWMSGRLASLYYQLYDATLSLCLSSKQALAREIGPERAGNPFTTPMWNDLYQGLLAGEGLLLELQKLENTYLKEDMRGLEVQATVSLNAQLNAAGSSFKDMLTATLQGEALSATGGVMMEVNSSNMLVITLGLNTLTLNSDYGTSADPKVGRLKNISVTLPALLGPYQDVKATLSHSLKGTYVALSRGLDDSGLFVVDFNDPKYLPFEGEPTDKGDLVLTFFKAGETEAQRNLVESLVDVIYHVRYTLKDY